MASKGGMGIELDLSAVPARETGMTPFEFMLSESQERMLIILKPGTEAQAEAIFKKWELDFAVIGHLTDTGRMVLRFNGEQVGDLPIDPLAQASPEYDRPWTKTPPPKPLSPVNHPLSLTEALLKLVGSPDMASRRWIWEQYDHLVRGDTAQIPGGDAAVVRVEDHPKKALAMTVDCTPRYCFADPVEGGKQAVAETWRNITAVGARPLAITDNMNFGNPQRPDIMGQFVGAVEGIREACLALDYPVVSGNVSLYNETNGKGILPTPAIGGVGVLDDVKRMATVAFKAAGETILIVGDTKGHLGQSIYLRDVCGREEGPPPPVDLKAEKRNGDFVRSLIEAGTIETVHDCSDGGLLATVAEMAMAGGIGASITLHEGDAFAMGYGEDQARYVLSCPTAQADAIIKAAGKAGIGVRKLGQTGGAELTVAGHGAISLARLKEAHEGWLPRYMAGEL
jgi:phosphoribosylformylglycinamidine synthase